MSDKPDNCVPCSKSRGFALTQSSVGNKKARTIKVGQPVVILMLLELRIILPIFKLGKYITVFGYERINLKKRNETIREVGNGGHETTMNHDAILTFSVVHKIT